MKIAAVIYKFFPYGGIQLDLLRILEECHIRGHQVTVFASRWEGECPNYIDLHLIGLRSCSNHYRMLEFSRKVNRAVSAGNYDLVFGVNRIEGLDVYFAGDNCYDAKAHNERSFFYRLTPRYRVYHKLEKSVFERGGRCRILLLTPGQQPVFEQYYHTEPERFVLLPPGIPKDRCRPDNADKVRSTKRMELGLRDDSEIMILQIGSGFATKGVDRSIRAVASLPAAWRSKTTLFIVGSDNPAKYIKLTRKLHIEDRVKFLGGRNDVPSLLLAADLMLHPAVNDATATVLAEAIVAGLPVICSDVCGFSSLITSARSGVVISSPFNQNELNTQLAKMLETPAQLQAYQDNAIMYADDADFFSRQKVAVDFMEKVVAEKAEE